MSARLPSLGIWSETGALTSCATFAPSAEFDCMVPAHIEALAADAHGQYQANPDYLLFDDLVQLSLLQSEHAQLTAVIRAVTGSAQQLDLRAMLVEILADPAAAAEIAQEVLVLEDQIEERPEKRQLARERLRDRTPGDWATMLLSGVDPHDNERVLRWPLPNWLFARDLWAVVGDAVVVGYPRSRARKRDGILARALLKYHRLLRDAPRLDVRAAALPPSGVAADEMNSDLCVEGGDVLVISPQLVLIGIGVRTTQRAAIALADLLRGRGVTRVLGVHLPTRRATMHLDTIFTLVDRDACLVFPPPFDDKSPPNDRVRVVDLAVPEIDLGCDLPNIVGQFAHRLDVIACGDGDPIAALREQWTDGANAFCLGAGRIVLYGRNTRTLQALNRAGFEVMQPEQFVANVDLLMQGTRRLVVALTGAELSRGRGGPRCLTLPLARQAGLRPIAGFQPSQ